MRGRVLDPAIYPDHVLVEILSSSFSNERCNIIVRTDLVASGQAAPLNSLELTQALRERPNPVTLEFPLGFLANEDTRWSHLAGMHSAAPLVPRHPAVANDMRGALVYAETLLKRRDSAPDGISCGQLNEDVLVWLSDGLPLSSRQGGEFEAWFRHSTTLEKPPYSRAHPFQLAQAARDRLLKLKAQNAPLASECLILLGVSGAGKPQLATDLVKFLSASSARTKPLEFGPPVVAEIVTLLTQCVPAGRNARPSSFAGVFFQLTFPSSAAHALHCSVILWHLAISPLSCKYRGLHEQQPLMYKVVVSVVAYQQGGTRRLSNGTTLPRIADPRDALWILRLERTFSRESMHPESGDASFFAEAYYQMGD